MKKLVYGLLSLSGALLVLLLAGPSFIDWNEYKAELARHIEEATGRPVAVGGDLSVAILPAPTLRIENITIGNLPQADEPVMVALDALAVRLALRPLFGGVIKAESIRLDAPVVHLQSFADGSNNWTFRPNQETPTGETQSGPEPETDAGPDLESADASGETGAISLEIADIQVKDARVVYHDATGQTLDLSGIGLEVAAESIQGPFEGQAEWSLNAVPLALRFSTGQVDINRPFTVDLELTLPKSETLAGLRGDVDLSDLEQPKFSGRAEVTGDSLRETLAAASDLSNRGGEAGRLPGLPGWDYQLTGDVKVDGSELAINDMTIRFGDLRGGGAVNAKLGESPEADLAVAFGRLDLDTLLAAMAKAGPEDDAGADDQPVKPDGGAPVENAQPAAGKNSTAGDFTVRANLAAAAMIYRGKPINDFAADLILSKRAVRLENLTARLPGGSDVTLAGTLDSSVTPPALEGNLRVESGNLRPDLEWLGVDIASVPNDRLRNFAVKAALKGDAKRLTVSDADISLDQTHAKAAAIVAFGKRLGLGLSFNIDKIDLDAYRPKAVAPSGGDAGGPESEDGQDRGESSSGDLLRAGSAPLTWPDFGIDANLRGRVGSLRINGLPVRQLSLDMSVSRDGLILNKAEAGDLAGLKGKAEGRIDGSGVLPKLDMSFTASTADAADSLRRLGGATTPLLQRLGAVEISGDLAGGVNSLRYDGAVKTGGGKLTWQSQLESLILSPQADLTFQADFPSFKTVAGLLAPDYRPADPDPGPVKLQGRVAGDLEKLAFSEVAGRIGPVDLQGSGDLDLSGGKPHLRAELTAGEIFLDPFLPAVEKRHGWRGAPSALPVIKAALGPQTAARALGRWSEKPYDLTALRALNADLSLSGQALRYGPYRFESPRLTLALDDGFIRLTPATGTLFGGDVSLQADLDARSTPLVRAVLSVKQADIGEALDLAGDLDVTAGRLDFDLDISGKGASEAGLITSLEGRSALMIEDGVVDGFNLSAFSQRLNQIDGAVGILQLLGTAMSGGQTAFKQVKGDFVIDRGVIMSERVDMIADAGRGQAKVLVDLPRYALDINAQFSLTGHPKAPPFGMRMTGPIDQPVRKFATKELQAYLLDRGVGALLRQVLPGQSKPAPSSAVPARPGGADGAAPPAAEQPPAGLPALPQDPEKALRSILEQLLP